MNVLIVANFAYKHLLDFEDTEVNITTKVFIYTYTHVLSFLDYFLV